MPSDFPRSPKLLKGTLVVYESKTPGPPPKVIVFQYSPEQLSRSLASRGAAREEVLRVLGLAVEESMNPSVSWNH